MTVKVALIPLFIGVCTLAAAQDQPQGQGQAGQGQSNQGQGQTSQGKMASDGRMSGTTGQMSKADQTFVYKAAVGGMAEVEMGQMATEKASDAKVKAFGQRMVTDHGKANDELKALAAKKSVDLPSETDSKHKATAAKMSKQSGAAFDRAYMRDMVQDHEKDVAEFQKEANSGSDPDVKAWAAKTLPTLQEHLQQAKDALSGVNGK